MPPSIAVVSLLSAMTVPSNWRLVVEWSKLQVATAVPKYDPSKKKFLEITSAVISGKMRVFAIEALPLTMPPKDISVSSGKSSSI